MRSRRTLIGGAVLLAIVVALYLVGRQADPALDVDRGAARGSLKDDEQTIEAALDAWKGADERTTAARVDPDAEVEVLYAGAVGDRDVVLLRQRRRVIALHDEHDRGWVVGGARADVDAFDPEPIALDDAILLPDDGLTFLPVEPGDVTVADGLVATGGELGHGMAIRTRTPGPHDLAKLYDTDAGTVHVGASIHRRVLAARERPGALLAIHTALRATAGERSRPRVGRTVLVAVASGEAERIELLVGERRITRPGPVAVLPVDWDVRTTGVVAYGRTRSGAVVPALVPR